MKIQYFSYGSNMCQDNMDRFCNHVKRPRIDLLTKNPRRGKLKDHLYNFDFYSKNMGCGAGNINPYPGEYVLGVVYELDEEDMTTMDMKEDAPRSYIRKEVPIELEDGTIIEKVITYIAVPETIGYFTPPKKSYLEDIIQGCQDNGLPKEWIKKLKNFPTI